jgi:hypothetical protein
MEMFNVDTTIKIVLVGDSAVGKTNLLHRYTDHTFLRNTKSTLGVDFISLEQQIDNAKVKIQFWDTAGQENFRAITRTHYKEVFYSEPVYLALVSYPLHLTSWICSILKLQVYNMLLAIELVLIVYFFCYFITIYINSKSIILEIQSKLICKNQYSIILRPMESF